MTSFRVGRAATCLRIKGYEIARRLSSCATRVGHDFGCKTRRRLLGGCCGGGGGGGVRGGVYYVHNNIILIYFRKAIARRWRQYAANHSLYDTNNHIVTIVVMSCENVFRFIAKYYSSGLRRQ